MNLLRRLLFLVFGTTLILSLMTSRGFPVATLVDLRALALTLAGPWVLLAITDSPMAAWSTLRHGLVGTGVQLPPGQRAGITSRLASVAGLSLGLGMLAGFLALVSGFNALAVSGGEVGVRDLAGVVGGLLLGPVYGLACKALLYEPAVAAMDATSAVLGESLAV